MKGVVFVEFLSFVAEQYGEDTVDDIIDSSQVPSGGAYTAVGTYDHAEMIALCGALAARINEPTANIIRGFGSHLSGAFARTYPTFFGAASYFDFLESIDAHIHVEVRKLYPDAELPSFKVKERTSTQLLLEYRSPRRLGHLAEGLLLGTAREFKIKVRVQSRLLEEATPDEAMLFVIDLVSD